MLHLEDCIAGCRGNESCLSVNYETGLCVMFDSSAELKPGESFITSREIANLRGDGFPN